MIQTKALSLAKMAEYDFYGFCIMDSDKSIYSYREEYPNKERCYRPDYRLACVASRWRNDQTGELAVKIYNNEN